MSPRLDAELLLAQASKVDRAYLMINFKDTVSPEIIVRFKSLLNERRRGVPVQYLTGHQEFWGLDFIVTPEALIPRPETEFLVEQTLHLIEQSPMGRVSEVTIVDVCTGSGCIAVALATELRRASLFATDISYNAVRVAKQNANRHAVQDRIFFCAGDLLPPLAGLTGKVDFIVCNPPYLSKKEMNTLQREVRDYEPRIAITDNADGLTVYRRLIPESAAWLRAGGYLILEMALGRCQAVTQLLDDRTWQIEAIVNDLQNIPRCIVAKKWINSK